MVDLTKKTIRLTEDATDYLRHFLQQMAGQVLSPVKSPEDSYINTDFQNALKKILQDRRVDRLEAKVLYSVLEGMAGTDRILARDEIDVEELDRIQTYTIETGLDWAVQDAFAKAIEEVFNGKATEETEEEVSPLTKIANRGLFAVYEEEFLFLKKEKEDFYHLDQVLHHTQRLMEGELRRIQIYIRKLRTEAESFAQFTNAENGWGYTSFQSEEGSPFSVLELDGALALHDYLSRAKIGLDTFHHRVIHEGLLPLEDPNVITFLNSPAAEIIDFAKYYDGYSDPKKDPEDPAMVHFYRRLIEEARDAGALKYAYGMAEYALEEYGENYSRYLLYDPLPKTVRAIREGFTDFANHYVNLPSAGVGVAGGVAGGLLAASTRGVALMEACYGALGRARYLLPGVTLFANRSGQHWPRSLGVAFGNIAAEIGKFNAVNSLAHPWSTSVEEEEYITMEGGVQNATYLALFIGGLNAGYASALESRILNESAAAKTSSWMRQLFEKGLFPRAQLEQRINRAAATGRRIRLRLSRAENPQPLRRNIGEQQRLFNKASRSEQKWRDRISQDREHLADLGEKHGKKWDRSLTERAQRLADEAEQGARPLDQIAQEMKGLKQEAEQLHGKLRQKEIAQRRVAEEAKQSKPVSNMKGPRRAKPADSHTPATSKNTNGAPTAKPASPQPNVSPKQKFKTLRGYRKNPPETLSDTNLQEVTGGHVKLDSAAEKKLQDLYKTFQPGEQRSFWRRILELTETTAAKRQTLSGNWKALQWTDEVTYANRIGRKWRIQVERENGTFRIVNVGHRRQVYGGLSDN